MSHVSTAMRANYNKVSEGEVKQVRRDRRERVLILGINDERVEWGSTRAVDNDIFTIHVNFKEGESSGQNREGGSRREPSASGSV